MNKTQSVNQEADLQRLLGMFERSLRAENKSVNTIKSYLGGMRRFVEFLEAQGMSLDPHSWAREHIETFLIEWGKTHKRSTVSTTYLDIRAFIRYLLDIDELSEQENPIARIKTPKPSDSYRRVLSEDEVQRVLKTCAGKSFVDRRDYAMIRILAVTGLRASELIQLHEKDVDQNALKLTVLGKGGRYRDVFYDRKSARAIDLYIWERRKHKFAHLSHLFIGQRGELRDSFLFQMVVRRGDEAKVSKLHPHLFRHYAIHKMLMGGMVEGSVMQISGHRDRNMLDRYGASAAASRAQADFKRLGIGDDL